MRLFRYLKKVIQEFGADRGSQLSATLAYTGIFALVPVLLVIISLASILLGQKAVEGTLFSNLTDIIGPSTAATLQHAIAHAHQSSHSGLALAIGLVGSILAASALTAELQYSFDRVFAVTPDPKGGLKRTIYIKLKNAITLIIGGIIVMATIVVTAALTAVGAAISNRLGMPTATLQVLNLGASLAVFILVLYLIYRVLPDVKIPPKVLLATAVVIGLLFLVGKVILGWVIGRNGTASAYGAAASVITLLLWFYYTGQILILGAEGIKVYGHSHGLIYKSKRYGLKQKTLTVHAKNNLRGDMTEKFARGFNRKVRGE